MFIGHFGVGFAAKKVSPRVSLGTLFMAAQFIDLLWPLFLLAGVERVEIDPGNTAFTPLDFAHYPFSHSLIGVAVWGILFGLIYYAFRRHIRNAVVLGVLVVSHWLLDVIVHRPDLPLAPWSDVKLGFGLWDSVVWSIVVEGLILAGGVLLYLMLTRAKDRTGTYALWGLLAFLLAVYVMNVVGPPPESGGQIAVVGLFQWLLVGWGYWVDRHRVMRS